MARIRTIKPEFPQSESMGRVSRDARLLYIMLWTIVDDSGRTRAASRMLASLLFPYDDDARTHITEWLFELEREGCIRLYEVEGNAYLQVEKWLEHQKIDKPSKSRLPDPSSIPREDSPKAREPSATDLVPSTLDLGRDLGGEVAAEAAPAPPSKPVEVSRETDEPETPEAEARATRWDAARKVPVDWIADAQATRRDHGLPEINLDLEAVNFADHWASKPGKDGRKLDWHRTWLTWARNSRSPPVRAAAKEEWRPLKVVGT